jgi:hypothetical protein
VLSEPLAAYVLTATRDYLRLYPISRAITGDRTVAKRVELHGRLQFASSFAANGAPALVCLIELEQEVHMQVRMRHLYLSYTVKGCVALTWGGYLQQGGMVTPTRGVTGNREGCQCQSEMRAQHYIGMSCS